MAFEIKNAEYLASYPDIKKAKLPPFPQVAFAGRSNVGKSSLINKLVGRKALAKVSSTPGKTRMLNFFLINNKYLWADLPGYGYAKVPKAMKQSWKAMVEGYLEGNDKLRGIVLLVDGRRGLQLEEKQLLDFCEYLGLNTVIVFTKADKLKQSERAKIRNKFPNCLFFSVLSGEGKRELLKIIGQLFLPERD